MSKNMDQEKFLKLYDETYHDVLKYLVCNVKHIRDVQDLIQEVYLALLKKKNKDIHPEYVLGIAKNKVKDYYRFRYRHKEEVDFDFETQMSYEKNFLDVLIRQDELDLVWHFFEKKKNIVGKIFFLYYYEGYSLKEIAGLLNLTESNVKHYLYRTLEEISDFLRREEEK